MIKHERMISPVPSRRHVTRLVSSVAALVLTLALGGSARPGQKVHRPSKTVPKAAKTTPAAVLEQLVRLDDEARHNFEKDHPGVLPEGPLQARLPLPTAREFNWCTLNEDFFVHDQGRSSSCWANSAIEALECSWLIRNGIRHALSPQPVLDFTQRPSGGTAEMAFDMLLRHGTAAMKEYIFTGRPGDVRTEISRRYRAVAWGRVGGPKGPLRVEELKSALLEHGPLVVNLFVTPAFEKYKKGVFAEHYKPGKDEPPHNHEVLLLGWDNRKGGGAWWIKNSWGPKWGELGYCWIEYGCNNVGWDAWWVKAQSTYYKLPATDFAHLLPDADPPMAWNSPVLAQAAVTAVHLQPETDQGGKRGILFKVSADLARAKGKQVQLIVFIDDQDGGFLATTHADYATRDGHLRVRTALQPAEDRCSLKDVELFLPYDVLPEGRSQTPYRFHVDLNCDGHWLCRGNLYRGSFVY